MTKRLIISNIVIHVDIPDNEQPAEFAAKAIDLINQLLQRESHALDAKVFTANDLSPGVSFGLYYPRKITDHKSVE